MIHLHKYTIIKNVGDIYELKNDELVRLKCISHSAKLEETYLCLKNKNENLLNSFNIYYDIISNFTDVKAHNPLVDAYYTFIIFIIMKNNLIIMT